MAWHVQHRRLHKTLKSMMRTGFIDDVYRGHLWHSREFFYDLLRPVIASATGIEPELSVRRQMWASGKLDAGVRPATLEANSANLWISEYWTLSEKAKKEFNAYISKDVLYFGYEMTPGLRSMLDEADIVYIDVRMSPLRFLPDLCLAVRSNSSNINGLLARHCIPEKDIVREAAFLKASQVHLQRYSQGHNAGREVVSYLIGQTEADASILTSRGFAKLQDYVSDIVSFADGKPLYVIPHPYCSEENNLKVVLELRNAGVEVLTVRTNGYDLLSSEQCVRLIGLSSGLLQEAPYFGQKSEHLLPFICPVGYSEEDISGGAYFQFDFDWFVSEEFVSALASLESCEEMPRSRVSNMKANRLRALHQAWWSYPDHVIRPSAQTRAICREVSTDVLKLNYKFECLQAYRPMSRLRAAWSKRHVPRSYTWLDGACVVLRADGAVFRNDALCGTHFFTRDKGADFVILWSDGYFCDVCKWISKSGSLQINNGDANLHHAQPVLE